MSVTVAGPETIFQYISGDGVLPAPGRIRVNSVKHLLQMQIAGLRYHVRDIISYVSCHAGDSGYSGSAILWVKTEDTFDTGVAKLDAYRTDGGGVDTIAVMDTESCGFVSEEIVRDLMYMK